MAKRGKMAIKKWGFRGKKCVIGVEKIRAGNQTRKAKWCRISYLIVSLFGTSYMGGELFLVLELNDINSAQFVEMIEVKATSI